MRFRKLVAESACVSVAHAAENIEVADGCAFRFFCIKDSEETGAAEAFRNLKHLFREVVCARAATRGCSGFISAEKHS